MRARTLTLFAVFALWLAPCLARAEPDKAPPAAYGEAIGQALSELEANNFPEARQEFLRAHSIFPNARTLRGLGMVEFELRNYAASVDLLAQALESRAKPLEGKLKGETESLLARARRYVGTLVLVIRPSDARVTIDGVATDARRGALQLDVGEHVVDAHASGYATNRQTVRVVSERESTLELNLNELEEHVAAPAASTPLTSIPPTPARSEQQPTYKKWWVWTMVAVVVAGGGATAAALLMTRAQRGEPRAIEGNGTQGVILQTLERF